MDTQEKIDLLKNNKSVAMLAPTFAIDFKYPNIIGMLHKLGFKEVTELTYGARMVNWAYAEYIKEHQDQKYFIASPCPTVVAMVKTQYPDLVKYLMPIVSPMVAMAKIYKKKHPTHKVFFISPCWAKENVEAPQYKDFIDGVITLKDLKDIFSAQNIKEEDFTEEYYFDSLVREYTKIYPISGGLASTSHIGGLFKEGEILVTDGVINIKKAFEDIKAGTSKYRFLDILNCDGGCIGGPAINNKDLPLETKREIIQKYTHRSSEATMGRHKGKVDYAKDINFSENFS
jgi:iron only hydrogenase large subunit-like protein